MIISRGNLHPSGVRWSHLDRPGLIYSGSLRPQLAICVIAPSPKAAVGFPTEGMKISRSYLRPGGVRLSHLDRPGLIESRSPRPQLAVGIIAPGPEASVRLQAEGMKRSRSQGSPSGIRRGDLDRTVFGCDVCRTHLAAGIISLGPEAAIGFQAQGMIFPSRNCNKRAHPFWNSTTASGISPTTGIQNEGKDDNLKKNQRK